MSSPSRKRLRAVLLDAFGTLLALDPPGPRLRDELRRRIGREVSAEAAEAAFRAEIAFYLDHHLEGADGPSLDALRDRCAAVIADALALAPRHRSEVRAAMLASLGFSAHTDAEEALRALRARGLRLVVVSNWDCSLPEVLAEAGIAALLDGVVPSATVGVAKPAAAVFEAALTLAGASPAEAVHVGDSPAHDVEGAQAAGIAALLLDRSGGADGRGEPATQPGPPDGAGSAPAPTIRSLRELPSLLFADR
jgi:putative hydrolase of the HAD superfamily